VTSRGGEDNNAVADLRPLVQSLSVVLMHAHTATGCDRQTELVDAVHHPSVVVDRDAVESDGRLAVVSTGEAGHVVEGHLRVRVTASLGLRVDLVLTRDRAIPTADDREPVHDFVLAVHRPHGHQRLVVDDPPTRTTVHRAFGHVASFGRSAGGAGLFDLAGWDGNRGFGDVGGSAGSRGVDGTLGGDVAVSRGGRDRQAEGEPGRGKDCYDAGEGHIGSVRERGVSRGTAVRWGGM